MHACTYCVYELYVYFTFIFHHTLYVPGMSLAPATDELLTTCFPDPAGPEPLFAAYPFLRVPLTSAHTSVV